MAMYNREAAVRYAKKWALARNPLYLDFEKLGGDCTNFVSQCLYAGIPEMNYSKSAGWYYINSYSRSPSWAGVTFLFDFLVKSHTAGPRAELVTASSMQPGDVVQLADAARGFHHSLIVISVSAGDLFVAAHSADAWMRPLSSYDSEQARFLRISGSS